MSAPLHWVQSARSVMQTPLPGDETPMGAKLRWLSGLLFYLIASGFAALCVAASLGTPPRLADAAPQSGIAENGGWRFGIEALEHAQARDVDVYVQRNLVGLPQALRLAATQGVNGEAGGIRLEFTPQVRRLLADRAVIVEVDVRPLEVTTAQALAVRAEGADLTPWQSAILIAEEPQTLRFALLKPAGELAAIWLRPVPPESRDYAYGVEVAEVRLSTP